MTVSKFKIKDLISKKITGEWGKDIPEGEVGVFVIRTTNFTNNGVINYSRIVRRKIDPKIVQNKKILINDIIIEKSGGSPSQPVGRVVIFENYDNQDYVCNNFTTVLRANNRLVYPKYLFYALYYMHLIGKTLQHQNKTTGIINLKLENYLEEEILIPDSYEHQIKLTKILDKSAFIINERKISIDKLDTFLYSVFSELFGNPIMNTKKWDTLPLGRIGTLVSGGTPTRSKPEYFEGDIPWITSVSLGKRNIGHADAVEFITDNALEFSTTKLIPSNSIMIGTRVGVGKASINNIPMCTNQDIVSLFNIDEGFNLNYLIDVLRHYEIFFNDQKRGATIQGITSALLKEIKIPKPDIDLQIYFSDIVNTTEIIKTNLQESHYKLKILHSSLLAKIFNNNLNFIDWVDFSKIVLNNEIAYIIGDKFEVPNELENQKVIDIINDVLIKQYINLPPVKGARPEIEDKIKKLEQEFSLTEEIPFDSDYVRFRVIRPSNVIWPITSSELVDIILSYKYFKDKPTPDNLREFFFTSLNSPKPFLKQAFDKEKKEIIFDLA